MGRKRDRDTNKRSDDAFDISTDSEVLRDFIKKSSVIPGPLVTPLLPKPLTQLEDRRAFHPERSGRPAGAVQRSNGRLVIPAAPSPKTHQRARLPVSVGFAVPEKVALCVRRRTRKEVLFAKRLTAKGARGNRRRNQWSDVKC